MTEKPKADVKPPVEKVEKPTPPKPTPPKPTQENPSEAPKRDKNGFELDQWDLPVSGPVRAARLEKLGLPDPHDDPSAWAGHVTDDEMENPNG